MEKDEKWKTYFEDNRRYADIINGIGCDGVQMVKDTDLLEADSAAGKKQRDLLRKAAFGMNFAIVGIENQEKTDYALPLRNMQYDIGWYGRQMAEIRRKVRANRKGLRPGEYMYGFKKESRLHPAVTFVLYAGEEPWDGPKCLYDILDFTDIPEKLKSMVYDYGTNIIDIRRFENTEVFRTDVKQVFDFIRCSESKEELKELVENDDYYRYMEKDAYEVVTSYTNATELVNIERYEQDGGKVDMCKAIKDLMDDSRTEGLELGRSEGIELGRSEGIELGRNEGIALGVKNSILNLMKNMELSAEEAMKVLGISEDEWENYTEMIQKEIAM